MFGHLGAKTGEQERKMRHMSEKVRFFRKVINGVKAYERDGTLFDNKPEKNMLLEQLAKTNIY